MVAEGPITVSIGRDVRLSSKAIFDVLAKNLNESGINCIDIGEVPDAATVLLHADFGRSGRCDDNRQP